MDPPRPTTFRRRIFRRSEPTAWRRGRDPPQWPSSATASRRCCSRTPTTPRGRRATRTRTRAGATGAVSSAWSRLLPPRPILRRDYREFGPEKKARKLAGLGFSLPPERMPHVRKCIILLRCFSRAADLERGRRTPKEREESGEASAFNGIHQLMLLVLRQLLSRRPHGALKAGDHHHCSL